jgi:hypothetical protein
VYFSSERVICVDDSFPNPLCRFPEGYVVRGQIYHVIRVRETGGVVIAGKPVFNLFTDDEVGWKPHRFRKLSDNPVEDNVEDLECVAV